MPYRTCDHLKEDGIYCSSPALRDQRYCYFHLNARARRVQAARHRLHGEPCRLQIPVLDNMHAVQAGLQQVVDALADNRIQNRRAALLLYALQQSATCLNSRPEWKGSRPEIEAGEPLCALEVSSLQDLYGLPFDTDLDAPPDVAAAQIDATVALPLESRPRQTEQPSLARVPARSDSPIKHDDSGLANCDLASHNLSRDWRATPATILKSGPVSSATVVEDSTDAAWTPKMGAHLLSNDDFACNSIAMRNLPNAHTRIPMKTRNFPQTGGGGASYCGSPKTGDVRPADSPDQFVDPVTPSQASRLRRKR